MSREVKFFPNQTMRALLLILLLGLVILGWFLFELHQLTSRYDTFINTAGENTEQTVTVSEVHKMCFPLLPVSIWNRDRTKVSDPPRWRRVLV